MQNYLTFPCSRRVIEEFRITNDQHNPCFYAIAVFSLEMFLIQSDGFVAHYLKYMSYLY